MFLSFLNKTIKEENVAPSVYARAIYLFEQQKETICARTDKLFAVLFLMQWFGAIAWPLLAPTRSWEGQSSAYHIQAWQSALFGACIFVLPIYFIIKKPGTEATRMMVAAAQMLWSGLLIAASGGRIETHFHVFGSLAFLAFYRDWRPLLLGSIITTVDHLIRGIYFPDTIYGVSTPERWRWIEFAGWVFFCDIFLIRSIRHSVNDMRLVALRQAELERAKSSTEQEVIERTAELKKSEQNLRDSEATIRAIFETAADSIITISENGAIETANQTCEKMFGYQFHQIFGKHISYLIHAFSDETCTQDSWPRLRDMGRFHHGALRIEGVGNARFRGSFPIEISLSYIDMKGRKLITAIIRDISERKEAERRVSEFYSIVSHELRTPLTSIRGSLGLLEGGIAGELPLETQELVGIARESCDRLIRLINDILDLKKLEAGKFEFNKVELSPAALLNMTISSTEGMAKERSVRLESGWTTKQMIVADIDRLNQVLVNLVSNAIKFSPKNGVVELSATAGDGMVRFAVRDHGKGIAVSQQHKLFNKFQQVDSSDIREQEGTGLGLAICKAIVEQHGGSIGVDSDIGKGATFWFCVPVGSETLFLTSAGRGNDIDAPESDEPGVEESTATIGKILSESFQSALVLIVEDDQSTRKTILHQLEPHGLRCVEASNAAQALQMVAADAPSLIILDVGLPDMDGFQFVNELADTESKLTPLLVYTGRDLAAEERKMLTIGFTRCLTKSKASQEDLLSAVYECLKHSEQESMAREGADSIVTEIVEVSTKETDSDKAGRQ